MIIGLECFLRKKKSFNFQYPGCFTLEKRLETFILTAWKFNFVPIIYHIFYKEEKVWGVEILK